VGEVNGVLDAHYGERNKVKNHLKVTKKHLKVTKKHLKVTFESDIEVPRTLKVPKMHLKVTGCYPR